MSDYMTAARPYANAVYALAAQTATLQSWGETLANLAALVLNEQVDKLLDNPDISRQQKADFIIGLLNDKPACQLSEQQQNLVRLMAENGRLKVLPDVASLYEVKHAEAENKMEAEVVSAFALTAQQTGEITHILKNKLGCEITLTTRVDESLIGGVVIKAGDTIIDASMKSQLESLALSLGR